MNIFLYGKDTFRSRAQVKRMIEKFKKDRDPQGLNVCVLDCEKAEQGEILEQIYASPFLAERRMVVLENLLASKKIDLIEQLKKRIVEKSLPDSNVLIFWEGTDKFLKKEIKDFFSLLQKEKFVYKMELLNTAEVKRWIIGEVKDREGKISNHAVSYLSQNTDGDMWLLNSLIDQLIALKGEEEIQIADIEKFIEKKVDDNIFNLVDFIVANQPRNVFQMIRQQYKVGKDPQYMFAMILRQFRILLELRDLYEREDISQSNVLAEKTGLHPFVVKKSFSFVKRYSYEKLKDVYEQLLEMDIKIKTGQGEPSLLLDMFVGRVSKEKQ